VKRRTLVNLITVIVASAVLVLFAVTQLLATAILDNTYPLFVELPEAGGLLENKQVTYRGVGVGSVTRVTLCGDDFAVGVPDCGSPDNVMVEMGIERDQLIPQGIDVVVLRQSAVGEQALDIRPYAPTGASTTFYEAREVLRPGQVVLPTKPQELLELASRVFGPVDPESAGILVAELADAVEGRSEDLQAILVDSASLSEAVGDNGADFDRLFAASRVVNATLAENRDALASLVVDLADTTALIGDIRDEVDALLVTAPTTLDATASLLERGDANLACVIRDLADINTYVNQPAQFSDLEESIRVNRFFFDAFRVIGPMSAQGQPWLRVHFISEPEPPAREYIPERPVPPTLPGGGCTSVFGPGAGPATQPGFQLVAPDSRLVPPTTEEPIVPTRFTATAGADG
jgi:phospholipid/cholesterol/gamma-HCH transport system substrate-binding protein